MEKPLRCLLLSMMPLMFLGCAPLDAWRTANGFGPGKNGRGCSQSFTQTGRVSNRSGADVGLEVSYFQRDVESALGRPRLRKIVHVKNGTRLNYKLGGFFQRMEGTYDTGGFPLDAVCISDSRGNETFFYLTENSFGRVTACHEWTEAGRVLTLMLPIGATCPQGMREQRGPQ